MAHAWLHPVLVGVAFSCGFLTTALAADAAPPAPFSTKHAHFVPSRFADLPGWRADDLAGAWKAFGQSCNALSRREAWAGPCARADRVDAGANDAIRRFLEREFTLYEIRNTDRTPTGVFTGYYEPLLKGSLDYAPPYVYPVYGLPDDLLYLDSRRIPRTSGNEEVLARIEGRDVVPVCTGRPSAPPCAASHTLDLGDSRPNIRDKRIRVRIDADRIVPYYTRDEIDKGALATRGVIAWVDNLASLYSMHIQGSGKIRLSDGRILRIAYAEQNGHPFKPPVRRTARTRGLSAPVELTRGLDLPLDEESSDPPPDYALAATADASPPRMPMTRGLRPQGDADRRAAPSARHEAADGEMSPEVARMVELLLKGSGTTIPQPAPATIGAAVANANVARPESAQPKAARPADDPGPVALTAAPPAVSGARDAGTGADKEISPEVARMVELLLKGSGTTVAQPAPATAGAALANAKAKAARPEPSQAKAARAEPPGPKTLSQAAATVPVATYTGIGRESPFSSDPSFVFFRQIPDADGGPLGALGVPLTPGRSVAVDPRTTPLGSPVFIATDSERTGGDINRLMFAQDTGGAIRGAVRADYFWGFGPNAHARASRMNDSGRMWLLLPKDLQLAAATPAVLTRGTGTSPRAILAECLVPDPELCVE